ncbi:hypothetical protein CesoFtcFv8_003970 [Champsocephalus esox]|uniref:Uncharacterized protein n=1 Tax=Champsocephalus esox TaxID=159716 RepID=A0AAN8HC25_9TELE|nr:hypothetical protein CesoFtcFv8_003970 [Champsocephalus esox]
MHQLPGLPRPSEFFCVTRRRLSLQSRLLSTVRQGLKFPRSYAQLGTSSSVTTHTEAPCSPLMMDLSGFWNTVTNTWWSTWAVRLSTSRLTG